MAVATYKESIMSRAGINATLVTGLILVPVIASAQTSSPGLLDQMKSLFLQSVLPAPTPGGRGIVAHDAIFGQSPQVAAVTALVSQISGQIGSQIATFPLASSSGGFTYSYDSSLGTFTRTTDLFGPAFAERAVTSGKGKFSLGMNYVHSKFTSLDGNDIRNGDIKFYLEHQQLNPRSFVEGDMIRATLDLKLTSDTFAFLANYGVTDRLDIGFAVPIVRTRMDLTYHATILDFATHTTAPTTHVFSDGRKTKDFTSQGVASGVGDAVVRAKFLLAGTGAQGVAAGIDVTVPSGDQTNMLGAGTTQAKVFFVGSGMAGAKVAPHVNVGYTVAGSGVSNQLNYAGGVEALASHRATIVADIVGRSFFNSLRIGNTTFTHAFRQANDAPLEMTAPLPTISVTSGTLSSLLGAAGVKLNPGGTFLISAHVLFPLNKAGLTSTVTPVIGFDYTF